MRKMWRESSSVWAGSSVALQVVGAFAATNLVNLKIVGILVLHDRKSELGSKPGSRVESLKHMQRPALHERVENKLGHHAG